MGDLFKKNWKKLTGVRPDEVPLSQDELARLKDILGGGSGIVSLGGDLGGTSDSAVVTGLQGEAVSPAAPGSGDVLTHDGTGWSAQTPVAGPSIGSEFRVDLPGNATLAGKIAAATLPAGWSIVLGNNGSVDAEIVATAADIVLVHTESSFAVHLELLSLHTTGPASLDGYTLVDYSAISPFSKSNQSGTQFSVLGFTGLVTMTDAHRLFVKMLPTP